MPQCIGAGASLARCSLVRHKLFVSLQPVKAPPSRHEFIPNWPCHVHSTACRYFQSHCIIVLRHYGRPSSLTVNSKLQSPSLMNFCIMPALFCVESKELNTTHLFQHLLPCHLLLIFSYSPTRLFA